MPAARWIPATEMNWLSMPLERNLSPLGIIASVWSEVSLDEIDTENGNVLRSTECIATEVTRSVHYSKIPLKSYCHKQHYSYWAHQWYSPWSFLKQYPIPGTLPSATLHRCSIDLSCNRTSIGICNVICGSQRKLTSTQWLSLSYLAEE